jgi:hypothetical protein
MSIDSAGNLLFGGITTGQTGTENTNNGMTFYRGGSFIVASAGQFAGIFVAKTGAGTTPSTLMNFSYNGTSRGSITTNGTSVAYNTTSDYRLKTNVEPLANAADTLMQVQPKTFAFIGDTSETVTPGFIAHELAQVVPSAVTGEKDEVDESGAPRYQSVDYSKLVPLLTAALQEALNRIEKLESKIETLTQ